MLIFEDMVTDTNKAEIREIIINYRKSALAKF